MAEKRRFHKGKFRNFIIIFNRSLLNLVFLLIISGVIFSGCVESQKSEKEAKTMVYGYISTIVLDKKDTEFVDLEDNYDTYEIESIHDDLSNYA